MDNSCNENLIYTISKYLSEQDNELDREISVLLNYADFDFIESSNYSNRYNCILATAVFKVPYKLKEKFSPQIISRLLQIINEFRPEDWEIDFSNVIIESKLEQSYDNWRNDILSKITGQGVNNQAIFKSTNHPMCEQDGIKFRSKSEMKLMRYFQAEKDVVFFPLPVAISGNEHKEPDYLVCKKGKWAILEVISDVYHPSVEKEANRTQWFQNHNIQIRPYTANECYNNPTDVVKTFLDWLSTVS